MLFRSFFSFEGLRERTNNTFNTYIETEQFQQTIRAQRPNSTTAKILATAGAPRIVGRRVLVPCHRMQGRIDYHVGCFDLDTGAPTLSPHVRWLRRVDERRASSDEQFVVHFREKYDDRMPVWALTELLELGQLSVLYRGLRQQEAEEIAMAFGAPTKKLMVSWAWSGVGAVARSAGAVAASTTVPPGDCSLHAVRAAPTARLPSA